MNSLIIKSKTLAACGIAAGFLAASTLAFAQDPNAPADLPEPQQQTAQAPDGGWPQASAPSDQGPEQNGAAANPYGQPPPAPRSPDPSVSLQQQPYGQPPYGQAPYGRPPQQQQRPYGQQPAYGQQPYGQGVYNQQQPAPPPVPAQLSLPAGTYVTARLNSRLASDRNQPGDAFTASLVEPVVVNGVVVAEPGQTITGHVQQAEKVDGTGRLAIQLTDLPLVDGQRIPIQTQLIARRGDRFRANDAGIVAGSTAAGAIIGSAIGWGTGAAIGAGAGALVSLGAVLTHGHASVLYPEEVLTFRLQQPVVISTDAAPQAFRYVEPGEYNGAPAAPNMTTSAPYPAAPPPPTYYAYGYPGYGYGYPYAYGYGPSFGFYFGPSYYRGGYYGHGYVGGHFYGGGSHGGDGYRSGGGYHGGHR